MQILSDVICTPTLNILTFNGHLILFYLKNNLDPSQNEAKT